MKILMLLSSLGIGGAETHVLELSLALLRKGHEVTVMSAGGEYVSALKGIKHIYAPLDKKVGILKSARMIRRELSDGYDVMHAHSRIAALAARIASRDVPLVVTAHWVFSTHFPYNVMSEWGEKTLAVSNDIKRYLIDRYNVYPDSITVTVNGVDTERFTSDKRSGKIKIVSTSRLDSDRSLCASMLIDLAERIYPKSPNSEIIIVGGGDCEADLRKKADAVNRRLGREYIRMTGATDSPEKYVKNADIFIGVSRAALEAMSTGCAVILAGNEGYLGIFDADYPTGVDSNFCCREGIKATEDNLFSDICTLIDKGRYVTAEMGVKNREFVKERYSTDKTCSDAEGVYQSVLRSSDRSAVICGYYGHGNFGDDATLIAMVALLRKNKINDITILCKNPKKVERIFSVYAKNRISPVKTSRTLRFADIFILGGGNLLQNETSARSLLYYSEIARMAKRRGCLVFVVSGGIGGLKGRRAAYICSEILSFSDTVVMRTSADFKNAKILAPFNKRIFRSCDITDTLPARDMSYFALPKENYILIMPKSMPSDFELHEMKEKAEGMSANIILLPLFEAQDTKVCKKINKKIPTAKILSGLSVYEIIQMISGALHCYCGRLHALLFANSLNRPFTVAKDSSVKIKNALADIEKK